MIKREIVNELYEPSRKNFQRKSTFSTLKASIVERFNRTLKELMWREFSFNGKYK